MCVGEKRTQGKGSHIQITKREVRKFYGEIGCKSQNSVQRNDHRSQDGFSMEGEVGSVW